MAANTAQLLEGKILAQKIQEEIRLGIEEIKAKHHPAPRMVSIQVTQDTWYISQQQKLATKLGIEFIWVPPQDVQTEAQLLNQIQQASEGGHIHGLFVTMPFPSNFNSEKILPAINPQKDVEGIHPTNLGLIVLRKSKLIPCTALAAFKLIEHTGIELRGKKATIIGQSAIVGRPLQMMLGEKRVTTIVCNSGTSEQDMKNFCLESDIVVGCAGQPGLIKGSWIKQGAIVIDVGTTEVNGKLVGDVEFETAKERASFITPVPGGVGPLTVTMLMWNLIQAYRWQGKI
ncbi:MAG: bifunctional 5,10-methylenetetrahydrofolate dehydrogenase/5,10-methenyltetrahydrofolate cyclohydrolase [Candidatus Omnitrophica bacterium]|nr:bifunctional 5,10-methylenetetrahydrofolate dehydrogenase/5,10-methenyltetrahydrofolate cyclohydrolase [Candidatus Omnitrophota bacterium]